MFSPENKHKNKGIQKKTGKYFFPVFVIFFVFGFLVWGGKTIFAATGINEQISFQGKVVNSNGTNVANASYNFLFCLYTTPTPSVPCTAGANNDALWRESKSLTVTDGIFQSNLGDTTTLPGSVDFNTDNIYLGINFNSDGEMSPLVRFTAAPYAMNAAKVGGLTVTDTTGTLTIPNSETISFGGSFTTTASNDIALTTSGATTLTLPTTGTLTTLAGSEVLTNKTIGSTGLTFSGAATDVTTAAGEDLTVVANGAGIINLNDSVTTGALTISGATTDITTGTGESLVIVANGAGVVDIQDATTVDSLTADTGGVSIAAGQSYTGTGAVTLSSTTNGLTLDSGNNTLTIAATDTALSATGVATLTLAPNVSITNASGNITLQPASSSTIANVQIGVGGAGSTTPDFFGLDVKSDTGDPAGGFEGAMYYNTSDNVFRCYQNTGWTNCIGSAGSQTPWTSDINAAGYDLGSLSNLAFQETTGAPTGTDVGFYRDNSGDLTGNVLTGKTFNLAVNGTDEYNFSSTGLEFNSNNITGLGTNLTAAGALTVASTTTGLTLDSGSNTLTVASSDTTLTASGLTTVTLGTNVSIASAGTITLDATSTTIIPDADTFQTNDVTSTGALTIASGAGGVLSMNSDTTGAINIGTDASAETINIGNTGAAVKTIKIGDQTQANIITIGTVTAGSAVSLLDDNWSIGTGGLITTAGGLSVTAGDIGLADTTGTTWSITTNGVATFASVTSSGTIAANGGITFDAATDTVGAHTMSGTLDMNSNIITNIGATTTDFTTSGSLTIALDAADANGALMVDNAAQANPIIVAKDNGTMVWQVGDNGLITIDPATTGTVENIALATQWTTGTVINAAFGSSTTQSAGTMTGVALDFNTNLSTPVAGQSVTGYDVKLPVASTTSNATVYTGYNLSTAGSVTNATAGSFAWRGLNVAMPNITQSAGGSVTSSGVLITSGSITTAGTENMLSLSASGVSVGTLNGLNIGTITGSTGTETAINVGSGWDTILGGTTAGTNLIGFTSFTVTSGGAVTAAGAIAANGGITFDAATDTVGAFTAAGTIDLNSNIITNIGNTGTDFVASTGALNLAGVLTANGGITLAGSQTFSASALSYMDLGAITHGTTANQGLRLPNAASASPSSPTGGLEGYIAWDASGNQLITYNGSAWSTIGGGSGYNLVKDETTGLTARTTLAFLGAGVTCTDSGSQTECTIAGGSGADLQGTYDTGAAGDQVIALDATQDSIIVRNPASSGSSSAFTFKIDQLAGGAVDGLQISNAGTGNGLTIDATGTGSLAVFKKSGVDKVTFANTGALTINGSDSSIVRNTSTEFSGGTVGSNLTNADGRIEMSDGTPANSGQGTITTTSQPATPSNIGAGAFAISRSDGKYAIVNGGASGTTQVYDPFAGTITAGQTVTCNGTTTVGVGSVALPRPNGSYVIVCGVSGSTTSATSRFDPMGTFGSRIGPALATAVTGAGTVAYKRPNGKYLVTIGASTPGSATNIYDPVADTFVAGPAGATGTWTTGSLALPMPDGRALIVNGGSTSTTNIYNPNGVSATIGTFTVGPSLDGVKTAGTCGINGSGSVAIKRQDGKYVILSKASVYAVFDPSALTMTCNSSVSNVSALGDGAHAIPIQNGKFLIFAGGNTTTAFVYDQNADSFAAYGGTAPTAITTGAHSILRPDGSWQVITGTNTCTNGCTNNFNTNLPMSDPYPAVLTVGAPSAGGSCTAGTHSYFVSFVGSVESELSAKSAIISCSGSNGTVGLSAIPIGPPGTASRKIYRTTAGDASIPKLLTTIADNTTTTYSDTTADGSLGADYSVTAATTWYTSEDISNSYLGVASTLRWSAQLEAVYAGVKNGVVNTAFKPMQFYVKTAVNNSGCATPLAAAQWQEIQNSGDNIRAVSGANCVKIAVHFNRAFPRKLFDDRGTWIGNNSTILRLDYVTPILFDFSIDNSTVLKRTAWDFSTPDANMAMATTVPTAPTSSAPGGSGSCTSGNHYWFVSFVINGAESLLSTNSTVQSCSGSNAETLTIPVGPSGTTARKIYRTAAGFLATDTPFLVGTQSDNYTTSYVDNLADSSLGAAYSQLTPSGPTLTRAEGSRVEVTNNQLTLPWGRITPTVLSTTAAGVGAVYMSAFGQGVPNLSNPASAGTMVIARDDKTFLIIEGGGATADLYDPATNTMTNQTGTGDKPTATVGPGGFAIRRPNGKYLVILGNNTTTTNIYDQYAPPGARFTAGPSLTGTAANQGAFAIQNADGTWTILPGNAATTTSIYDPVRNTMTVGPLQTTGTNYGAMAIPLIGPANNNIYKVILGNTLSGAVATGTMDYNANTKIFVAGRVLGAGIGSGAVAFQRPDLYWVLVKGESAANTLGNLTSLINPYTGAEAVSGTNMTGAAAGRGTTVIPRADGTFLVTSGNSLAAATTGVSILTNIYFPWGGTWNATVGVQEGKWAAGPTLVMQGQTTAAIAAPTTATPVSGGANGCDTGTHLWRYTYVTNGVESALSTAGTVQTCTATTLGQENLSVISAGPTGTTARKVYRTKAGTTAPYFLVTTINDNTTTTYSDSAADSSLTVTYWAGGPGDGAVSFQRPDGKFMTIFGGAPHTSLTTTGIGSTTVDLYDAGWYSDGQYLSEAMSVPAMTSNSTLEWQQTADQYVRMEARTASSEANLRTTTFKPVNHPGESIGNAGGETWAQVVINFRRDFPTWGYNQTGVYVSVGGVANGYRTIPTPTVNSFQITNGMDLMSLQNNGLNVFRVTSNGSILSSSTGGFYSGGADLAENYTSTQTLAKGEVVMIDPTNPQAVLRSAGQYQSSVLGVVSTEPGFVAGGYTAESYPIALVGRVPVRVSTENGAIRTGDFLTAASIPGYAMRATQAGRVIGKALEDFKPGDDASCPSQGLGNLSTTKCGSVMLFVNLTDYYGTPLEVVMAERAAADAAVTEGLDTVTASDEAGEGLASMRAVRLAVSPPTKEELMLSFLKKMRDERSSNLAPQSEVFTDRVSATDEIIAPTIVTDTLFAKHIKADSIEGLQIFTDQISSLTEKYAGLEADLSTAAASDATPETDAAMKALTIESAKVTLALQVLGELSADGGIVIGGPAEFNGNTIFNKLTTFVAETLFKGKVSFEKAPTFGSDTAGFALIEKGATRVRITFDDPYERQPIVTASLTNDRSPLLDDKADDSLKADVALVEADFQDNVFGSDVRFLVTEKEKNGFTIVLNKPAPYDLQFSWVAIAVTQSKTFTSEPLREEVYEASLDIQPTENPVIQTSSTSEVSESLMKPEDKTVNPEAEAANNKENLSDPLSTASTLSETDGTNPVMTTP